MDTIVLYFVVIPNGSRSLAFRYTEYLVPGTIPKVLVLVRGTKCSGTSTILQVLVYEDAGVSQFQDLYSTPFVGIRWSLTEK